MQILYYQSNHIIKNKGISFIISCGKFNIYNHENAIDFHFLNKLDNYGVLKHSLLSQTTLHIFYREYQNNIYNYQHYQVCMSNSHIILSNIKNKVILYLLCNNFSKFCNSLNNSFII